MPDPRMPTGLQNPESPEIPIEIRIEPDGKDFFIYLYGQPEHEDSTYYLQAAQRLIEIDLKGTEDLDYIDFLDSRPFGERLKQGRRYRVFSSEGFIRRDIEEKLSPSSLVKKVEATQREDREYADRQEKLRIHSETICRAYKNERSRLWQALYDQRQVYQDGSCMDTSVKPPSVDIKFYEDHILSELPYFISQRRVLVSGKDEEDPLKEAIVQALQEAFAQMGKVEQCVHVDGWGFESSHGGRLKDQGFEYNQIFLAPSSYEHDAIVPTNEQAPFVFDKKKVLVRAVELLVARYMKSSKTKNQLKIDLNAWQKKG